jgi:cell pole-organizing protein PopZ
MKDTQDMSMEEILASIRRYVGGDQNPHQHSKAVSQPFILEEDPALLDPLPESLYSDADSSHSSVTEQRNPFQILKQVIQEKKHTHHEIGASSSKNSQEQFFEDFLTNLSKSMIQQWISTHLKDLVEKIILEEIKKIKSL